jgi:ABC-type Fe3+/spermidine/putrescine transport system ATPase subunit
MTNGSDAIIELRGITKRWGSFIGLEEINLSVRRGEILTLLGPSGCGKSTLMRIVAGFESANSGEVIIDGRDVSRAAPEKRPVNMVFQRYALFPHLDVFDNVAFGPRLKGTPRAQLQAEVMAMLKLVQLDSFGNRWISELSGGQAQRVALARALVNRPSVLLLDEPLAALDLKIRLQMLEELKRIHTETETTFLYVTHDQDEAMILSDRVVLMNRGQIEQIGTPDELYGAPKTLFCARFFGETNIINGRVSRVDVQGVIVDTAIGPIITIVNAAVGEMLHLSVRPEAISLSNRSASEGPGLVGRIEDVLFIGSRVVYKVRHPSGIVFRAQEPRGPHGIRFAEGSDVSFAWDQASVVAVAG